MPSLNISEAPRIRRRQTVDAYWCVLNEWECRSHSRLVVLWLAHQLALDESMIEQIKLLLNPGRSVRVNRNSREDSIGLKSQLFPLLGNVEGRASREAADSVATNIKDYLRQSID